jgi:hypothetical protein
MMSLDRVIYVASNRISILTKTKCCCNSNNNDGGGGGRGDVAEI